MCHFADVRKMIPSEGTCGRPWIRATPSGFWTVSALCTHGFTPVPVLWSPLRGSHVPQRVCISPIQCARPKPQRGGNITGRGVNPCWANGCAMGTPKGWKQYGRYRGIRIHECSHTNCKYPKRATPSGFWTVSTLCTHGLTPVPVL